MRFWEKFENSDFLFLEKRCNMHVKRLCRRVVLFQPGHACSPDFMLACCTGINQSQGINFGALFGTEQALLKDPKRELAVQQSGIPFTIVRAGKIQNQPGSNMQLNISQDDQTSGEIR